MSSIFDKIITNTSWYPAGISVIVVQDGIIESTQFGKDLLGIALSSKLSSIPVGTKVTKFRVQKFKKYISGPNIELHPVEPEESIYKVVEIL